MSTIMFPQKDLREETAALRAQILDRLSKLPWDGLSFAHPVPGLSLYRIVEPAGPFSSVYEPSLSFIIKGSKNVRVGNETLVYDEGCFFLTAIGVPVTAQICAASEGEPYVAAALRLDMEKCGASLLITTYTRPTFPNATLVWLSVPRRASSSTPCSG